MDTTKISTIFVIALMVVGCSSASRVEKLVPPTDEVTIVNRHDAGVRVSVIGGDEYTVGSGSFLSALVQLINTTMVFSTASTHGDSQYELVVLILTLERSTFGGEAEISSNWSLRTADGTEVWSDKIHGTGSSAAFAGVQRLRAANERAAKDAIINGVEKLSQLSL